VTEREVGRPASGWGRAPAAGGVTWTLLALALACTGCSATAGAAGYVWFDTYGEQPVTDAAYVIAPGDLLNIRVYGQEGMSGKARVRGDGMISLPFLNDVQAADLAPMVLAERIRARLMEFVLEPVVSVSLEEAHRLEVPVLGEVRKPGTYQLEPRASLLQSLALAGGLGDVADGNRVFVLRGRERIRFTYRSLIQAEPRALGFRLRTGDVVVVE
jgi:polysaccharide export outer membrane protein